MALASILVRTARELWRDGRLPAATVLVLALGFLALSMDRVRWSENERDRLAAEALDGDTWNAQGARNPHSAAHFSRFAFRPSSRLSILDPGVEAYAGSAVWMEAHYQDPPGFRSAEDRLDLGRAADLNLAWLLQAVVPLLLIVLGYDVFVRERERGTLAINLVGGASRRRLAFGKGALLAGWVALIVGLLALAPMIANRADAGMMARIALWSGLHVMFLWTIVGVVVLVSLRARSARVALIVLLGAWAFCILAMPRIASALAASIAPTPTPAAFIEAIKHDIADGIDGHDSSDRRQAALLERVLAEHGVTRREDLPVSFAAIAMQAAEEYGNRVFDKHFGALVAIQQTQRAWRQASAIFGPVPVIAHASAAIAMTDEARQADFTQQAESQRRDIIRLLNEDMKLHGAGKDFDYLAAPELWARIPAFTYAEPSLGRSLSQALVDIAIALLWLAGVIGALVWTTRSRAVVR